MTHQWLIHTRRAINRHRTLIFLLLVLVVLAVKLQGESLLGLLAAASSSISSSSTTAYFTPYDQETLHVGDTAEIDVNINAKVPINALGIIIKFPQDALEIVGISKKRSFLDLWTEETVIKEESGEVHFSGGTTRRGGLEGVGTALTMSVRAKKEGEAKLYFENVSIFAHDGKGTAVKSTNHPFTYEILKKEEMVSPASGGTNNNNVVVELTPTAPSADFNNNGSVTLVDMSILTIRMIAPYNARYDLDMDGNVGLSDLSILMSQMGRQQ